MLRIMGGPSTLLSGNIVLDNYHDGGCTLQLFSLTYVQYIMILSIQFPSVHFGLLGSKASL